MTDSEKLDLLLSEMQDMRSEVQDMKADIQDAKTEIQDVQKDASALRRQIMKSTAELKAMDELILDEVERVHDILDNHKADKDAHTA